jgi:hypothetical protein
MSGLQIAILVVLAILVVGVVVLYFLGNKAKKKQAENEKAMAEVAQPMNLFIIDKKVMKLKDANLPKVVLEQTPKYLRRAKLPMVKVKVGPKVMSLICDEKVYETLLPKQEVKATVSGIYITAAKRVRGPVYVKEEKKGLFRKKKNK